MKLVVPINTELGENIANYNSITKLITDFQNRIGATGHTINTLTNNVSGFIFPSKEAMKDYIDFSSIKSVVKDNGDRYYIAYFDKYTQSGRMLHRSLIQLCEIRKNNLSELSKFGLNQVSFTNLEIETTTNGYEIIIHENIQVYATLLPYIENSLVKN